MDQLLGPLAVLKSERGDIKYRVENPRKQDTHSCAKILQLHGLVLAMPFKRLERHRSQDDQIDL